MFSPFLHDRNTDTIMQIPKRSLTSKSTKISTMAYFLHPNHKMQPYMILVSGILLSSVCVQVYHNHDSTLLIYQVFLMTSIKDNYA